jgi:formylglycine-generating enzyme required for sulfatase activity
VQGQAPQRLELDAGLHQLEISAPGRRAWRSEVAIIAGQTLDLGRIDLALPPAVVISAAIGRQAEASGVSAPLAPSGPDAQANPVPPRPAPAPLLHSALLGQLVLLPAGEYLQGSDRREQGRRSNEVQRRVTLTRPFYLAATEVSNAQFTAFRAEHVAGLVAERSLDLEPQAVSNVTWNDAVEFCNWLSLREGLPAAYERRDGRWQLVRPLNHGFRLPTEAEWEYAARYVDGQRWQRYAWGDTVPPPRGAANLAGTEALAKKPGADAPASSSVPQYTDDHEVIGPVNAYARTPAGLHGMGGNVSEWMHDVYVSLPADAPVSDPMGPEQDAPHAIRGANWRSAAIAELRLAWRERGALPSPLIGFRVARFAQESP